MKLVKLFLLVIVFNANVYPNICKSIQSFNDVKNILEASTINSLIVFDVDEVLIMPEDRILQKKYRVSSYRQYIESKFQINDLHQSIIMMQSVKKIIEPEIVSIINDLQKKNIKVIALTYLECGSFGLIKNLLEWRFNDLFKLGIDLSKNFEFNNLIFKNLRPHNNSYPAFYKGVICTNLHDKGLVLCEFLKALNILPDKIIFFDDRIANVRSVFEHMHRLKIPVYSYHYLGEEKIGNADSEPNEIEKRIAEKQFEYLIKFGKWIGDLSN